MQGNADSALGHMKPVGGLPDAAAIDGNRLDDFALADLQLCKKPVDLARGGSISVILRTKRVDHLVDRHGDMPAPPAQCVDELVADNRGNPGADRSRLIPGAALEMYREENFLHDIFHVPFEGAGHAATMTRHRAKMRRYSHEEPAIRGSITRNRGSHPCRPVSFPRPAVHVLPSLRTPSCPSQPRCLGPG